MKRINLRAIAYTAIAGAMLCACLPAAAETTTEEDKPLVQSLKPLREIYTAENIIGIWHWIYNEYSGQNVSRETYSEEIFCEDITRLEYIDWIIPTQDVDIAVKLHILAAMKEAEEELCLRSS